MSVLGIEPRASTMPEKGSPTKAIPQCPHKTFNVSTIQKDSNGDRYANELTLESPSYSILQALYLQNEEKL